MRKFTIVLTFSLAVLNGGVVLAQNKLPRTSPSEQECRGLNRSIQQQEQNMQQQQQDRFQDQMLLNQEDRNLRDFPSTGSIRRGCPSGSVGC